MPVVPAESRRSVMVLRIQAFIEHHLGDPDRSPGMIAAAHHISVRTLYKLYASQDHTIAALIRRRRLERCRRELLDAGQGRHPTGLRRSGDTKTPAPKRSLELPKARLRRADGA